MTFIQMDIKISKLLALCCRYLNEHEGIILEVARYQDKGLPDEEIIMEKLVANPIHVLKIIRAALSFTNDCIPLIQKYVCKLIQVSFFSFCSLVLKNHRNLLNPFEENYKFVINCRLVRYPKSNLGKLNQ